MLELLNLIALHDQGLYDRAARRWLARLLAERDDLTVADIQLAAAAVAALATTSRAAAVDLLRSLAAPARGRADC